MIDDSLRRAALERRVKVNLLASHWNHTRPDMVHWLKSLEVLSMKFPTVKIETVSAKYLL